MKRNLEKAQQGQESTSKNPTKRSKSSQACTSCRRHKTRCEHEGPGSKCHRCKVLHLQCTFGDAVVDPAHPSPKTATSSTPEWEHGPLNTDSQPISSSSESPLVQPSIPSTRDTIVLNVEDILPVQNPAPFPAGRDWTATPILAIQELSRNSPFTHARNSTSDISLSSILSKDRISYLLDIFETKYSPWLSLPLQRDIETPLLDLIRCMIASRHLDITTRSDAAPRLQRLTQEVISKQMFNSVPSTESVESLLILSLWAPIGSTDPNEDRDARMLVGTAVNAAMNLRLNEASSRVNKLRDEGGNELSSETDKVRLWVALSTCESALCLGTGRSPLSIRSDQDIAVVDPTVFPAPEHSLQGGDRHMSTFTVEKTRDLRLGLLAQLFNNTERGYRIHITRRSDLDAFQKEAYEVLAQMDRLFRLISPLPIVLKHETFHSQMLLVQYHGCKLLVLHHFLRELRTLPPEDSDSSRPWYRMKHNGFSLALDMGRDALIQSESVLASALRLPADSMLLGTAPDTFFNFVSFAATFIILSHISVTQTHPGTHISGAGESLLVMTVERFSQAACTADHAPARCAQLISTLIETWRKKRASLPQGVPAIQLEAAGLNCGANQVHSYEKIPSLSAGSDSAANLFPNTNSHEDLDQDLNGMVDADIFRDVDFWSSFMDNLNNDIPSLSS